MGKGRNNGGRGYLPYGWGFWRVTNRRAYKQFSESAKQNYVIQQYSKGT